MAIVTTDFVRQTLARHCFGMISSFDGNKRNEMTRVFGYSFNESTGILTAMVLKEDSAKLLSCLARTKKLAFVATDPPTHHTLQMKGDYLSHADATPEEVNLIKNEFDHSRSEVFKMFHCPENFGDNLKRLPALSIKMECREIYDQTPRINTGNKISQA